jgi:hypothetical protein
MATIIVDKLMAIAERSPALRGRRLTRPSNFLYMILYIGGGHTVGCAVLAFVCLQ